MKLHPLIRLLGQKVAAVERNRPYGVRNRIFRLPPLPSQPGPRKLVILCEPRTFSDGCWCAWSWLRFLQPLLHLELFVDGPLTEDQRRRFTALFPGATLSSVPEFLAEHPAPSPAFARFLDHYTYARKLALLVALQKKGDFLYSDADIVAFRRPAALIEAIENPGSADLFMEETSCYCVDPWVAETAARLNLPRHNDLNSGLLWVRRDSLDLAAAERLLTEWRPEFGHRVAEQTIIGVLMAVNGARALPPEAYVVSNDGMFFWQRDRTDYDRIVARHYVGNVRHLLYRAALPRLAAAARRPAAQPPLDTALQSAH